MFVRIGTSFRRKKSLDAGRAAADQASHPLGFAAFAAVLLGGLLVVAIPLDVANQTFFFAHLFEPLDHLLDALTRT